MQNWKVYLWAAVHSDKFWMCYINLPISADISTMRCGERYYVRFNLVLSWPRPYLPWDVKNQYYDALKIPGKYDDLPF